MTLFDKIRAKAAVKRRRIGIGLIEVDDEIKAGLEKSLQIADVVVIGATVNGFESITQGDPGTTLVSLLKNGEIDGAVRGNLSNQPAIYDQLKAEFGLERIYRCSLIKDALGREFFFGPTGLDEGLGREDKLAYITKVIEFIRAFNIEPKIGLLSGRRHEDAGINQDADKLYEDAEWVEGRLRDDAHQVQHFTIELEKAIPNSNFVVPANGMIGNAISRALWLVGGAGRLLALPILTDKFVFDDTSRNEKDFSNHIVFSAAWANWS